MNYESVDYYEVMWAKATAFQRDITETYIRGVIVFTSHNVASYDVIHII